MPTYGQACQWWAATDHWTLDDAVRLVIEALPASLNAQLSAEARQRYAVLYELALNCLGGSLPEAPGPYQDARYRVSPRDFWAWAQAMGLPIPKPLEQAITRHAAPEERVLNATQRRRAKCRALAALKWRDNPTITIAAMRQDADLLQFGCERHKYAHGVPDGWINDLCPNRQPGRRPQQDSP